MVCWYKLVGMVLCWCLLMQVMGFRQVMGLGSFGFSRVFLWWLEFFRLLPVCLLFDRDLMQVWHMLALGVYGL